MHRYMRYIVLVLLLSVQWSCAAVSKDQSTFEVVECWSEIPAGIDVTCGYIKVPEDRTRPFIPENTIQLAVAVFHSTSESPARDPVVYQVGGPGGHMLEIVPFIFEKTIKPFLGTRDLILFDPRGTGFSKPALECKNEEEPGDCVRRLFAEGHDLYSYSSVSMAEDLQDLRASLGYVRWNLLGESYGTHVAQIILLEASEGLRSVILDSVMPVIIPELPNGKSSFEAALQRLFQHCEENPACNAEYPHLPESLQKAIQHLEASPVTLRTNCYGQEKTDVLTGDRLTAMLFNALYETELIPYVPYAITAAAEGSDYSFWERVLCWETVIDNILSEGAHWAIQCSDGRLGGECEDWPIVVEQSPVRSDIPVLILSGEFDPVTPVEYGHSVARSLSRSYVFDFPGMGHWINGTGHPCQNEIIQSFLETPLQKPNSSCIKEMAHPDFRLYRNCRD